MYSRRSNAETDLSTPPAADVVIYDESCGLCRATVRALRRLDWRGSLRFLPLQDPRTRDWYPDLTPEKLEKYVHVVDARGRRRLGAEAGRYLTRRVPALWPMAPLLHIPGSAPLWHWLYEQISRRRHCLDRPE